MATTTLLERPHQLTALKVLYLWTIVGAGPIGLWMLLSPHSFARVFALADDPFVVGIVGAVDTAFAAIALLGLRAPDRFAPAFLLQLVYKSLWLVLVLAPRAVHGGVPASAWINAAVFASYVVLDVLALPFASLLQKPATSRSRSTNPTDA